MKMLLKLFICLCMGSLFGWFTAHEWQKHHKKEICEWKQIEPVKKIVTKDDIRIINWKNKK